MPSVLIADDEPNIRRMVGALVRAEGWEVREAPDAASAVTAIAEDEPDVAVLDLMMPGATDGMGALELVRKSHPELPVIMMSGKAGLSDAVRATKLGAFTFLEKPLTPESILVALGSAHELRQTRRVARAMREELGLGGTMVGDSPAMARVREMISRVAAADAPVLLSGESGTGKELAAAAIHVGSPRRDRPLVRVNCAAIPRDLVESEMFGHERGAFTGALRTHIGSFEMANSGTLFLDEIGDLSAEAQAKLLRAIESKEFQRVGGSRSIKVDVRIISATNKDLQAAVREGRFREDLLFRLNVLPISLPPLRERVGDVRSLVCHFSARYRERTGHSPPEWTEEAIAVFTSYQWPGNVRELANVVERLAILQAGTPITGSQARAVLQSAPAGIVGVEQPPAQTDISLSDALDAYERSLIARALDAAVGNVAEAARRLSTDRPNLYRRMKRLGLDVSRAESRGDEP
jgi:two-component system, NtrC family, nitrogen regulation response regulator NtrX